MQEQKEQAGFGTLLLASCQYALLKAYGKYMNQQQFDALFTSLYFALSSHSRKSGIVFRKVQSFHADGYALIELDHGYSLKLELADLAAYRDASALKKRRLLDGFIGQARLALSVPEKRTEVAPPDSLEQN